VIGKLLERRARGLGERNAHKQSIQGTEGGQRLEPLSMPLRTLPIGRGDNGSMSLQYNASVSFGSGVFRECRRLRH
jgi:hypothetical protein